MTLHGVAVYVAPQSQQHPFTERESQSIAAGFSISIKTVENPLLFRCGYTRSVIPDGNVIERTSGFRGNLNAKVRALFVIQSVFQQVEQDIDEKVLVAEKFKIHQYFFMNQFSVLRAAVPVTVYSRTDKIFSRMPFEIPVIQRSVLKTGQDGIDDFISPPDRHRTLFDDVVDVDQTGVTQIEFFRHIPVMRLVGQDRLQRTHGIGNRTERISHFMGDTPAQALQKRYPALIGDLFSMIGYNASDQGEEIGRHVLGLKVGIADIAVDCQHGSISHRKTDQCDKAYKAPVIDDKYENEQGSHRRHRPCC